MDRPIQRPVSTSPAPVAMRPGMMAPPGGMAGAGAMAMTPKEILGILRRHVWMIIIFTILGTLLGGIGWFLLDRFKPRYTAVGVISVSPPGIKDPDKLQETQPQKDTYYQHRFTMASYVKQQGMLEELIRQPKIRETGWFKQYAQVNDRGEIIGDKEKAITKALEALKDDLNASAPRDQNFIQITMSCASAKEAKDIVDETVRLFIQQQKQLAIGDVTDELARRKQQRDEIQRRLDQTEASLEAIRSGTDYARLNLKGNQAFRDYMDESLGDLETQRSNLTSEKSRLESLIAAIEARAKMENFDEVVQEQVENDTIARQMRANIASVEPVLNRQLARFGEEHRIVKETRAALKQMQDDLAARKLFIGDILRKSQYQSAQETMAAHMSQLETTTTNLQEAQTRYKQVDQLRNNYAVYERKREEEQTLLEDMNKQIEKLNAVYNDPDLSTLKSLGLAAKPRIKSFPQIKLFLPGGFMLGLLAGLGLAFLIEMANDLVRSPSDVMRHVKAPLLGMICHTDDDTDIDGIDLYHVVRQAPYSIMSECYRQLRTNLKLSGEGGTPHKTLLVTSSQAGDGKTTVAVNMASTLLAENRKVLLIDGNFRRPTTPRLFPRTLANGSPAEYTDYGLSNYLMGQCTDENQIIRQSGIENLYVIDSGPLPANPAELLTGDRMKALLDKCKDKFDYVVIDGPATLVSDSKTLAAQADSTIVVFNAENTHRGAATRILRELRDIHANVIGTVLMGVKTRKGGYFREIYRSYQEYQRVHVDQPAV